MFKVVSRLTAALFVSVLGFNSAQAAPDIFVDTSAVDYGAVQLGTTDSRIVTVYNQGDQDLQVFTSFTSPETGLVQEFGVTSIQIDGRYLASCTSYLSPARCVIWPGGYIQFPVAYAPSYLASASSDFKLSSNDPDTPLVSVPLTGTATYAELGCALNVGDDISFPLTAIDYGELIIPDAVNKAIKLFNYGSTDCQISNIAVTGSAAFSLDGDSDLATSDPVANLGPITVSPSSARSAQIIYTSYAATEAGIDAGTLEFNSDDNDQPVYPVSLAGTALDPVVLPGEFDFEPQPFDPFGTWPENSGYSYAYEGSPVTVVVERLNGSDGVVSVDYAAVDRTAIAGLDFAATSGTLVWADGDATPKTFTVDTYVDAYEGGYEEFVLLLSNPTGGAAIHENYYLWGDEWALIIDTVTPDTITFPVTNYSVDEIDGFVDITVRRVGDGDGDVIYNYTTTDGTAVAGVDYAATVGQIVWPNGDLSDKTITVPVYTDLQLEPGEIFFIDGSVYDGIVPTAVTDGSRPTIEIVDSSNTDTIAFEAAGYSVSESGGSVTVTLTRTGNGVGAIAVGYTTSDGTALAVSDYASASGTVSWLDGDLSAKTITIPIAADTLFESDEVFYLTVAINAGDAVLGGPDTASITITDATVNEAPVADAGGPYTGYIGSPITFDGSASSDANFETLTYAWDFGDGTTGSGAVVDHTYNPKRDSSYTVTLTVTDGHGASSTATTTVNVTKPPKDGGGSTDPVDESGRKLCSDGIDNDGDGLVDAEDPGCAGGGGKGGGGKK